MGYEDDDLRLNSTLLLYDKYQEENIIFCDAQISYIVTPLSKQTFSKIAIKGSFFDDKKLLLCMFQWTTITGLIFIACGFIIYCVLMSR